MILCIAIVLLVGIVTMMKDSLAVCIALVSGLVIALYFLDLENVSAQVQGEQAIQMMVPAFGTGITFGLLFFYGLLVGRSVMGPDFEWVYGLISLISLCGAFGAVLGSITHLIAAFEIDPNREASKWFAGTVRKLLSTCTVLLGPDTAELFSSVFITNGAEKISKITFHGGVLLHAICLLGFVLEAIFCAVTGDWAEAIAFICFTIGMGPNCLIEARDHYKQEKMVKDLAIPENFVSKISAQPTILYDVWDIPSQQEFRATDKFLFSDGVYLVVVDLCTELQRDRISFWLDQIKLRGTNSHVLIFAIHEEQDSSVTQKMQIIKEIAQSSVSEIPICCVNFKKGDVQDARKAIQKVVSNDSTKCKLRWLVYLERLRAVCDPESVTTLQEAKNIARDFGMQEQEMLQALQFYHQIGEIKHYQELPDVVFTQPIQIAQLLTTALYLPRSELESVCLRELSSTTTRFVNAKMQRALFQDIN